jgi:hypothetical protein
MWYPLRYDTIIFMITSVGTVGGTPWASRQLQ